MAVPVEQRDPADIRVGDQLPPVVRGPIGRGTLALFAGASNDHVLLHIDSDYAQAAGMPDVFAHGMLSMAYLGQLLTGWRPQSQLRSWKVRFTAITPLYATVRCSGTVTELFEEAGEVRARVRVAAQIDGDVSSLEGEAIVAVG